MRYFFARLLLVVFGLWVGAAYNPTASEWRLHDRLVDKLATVYNTQQAREQRAWEMVDKMKKIDLFLDDKSLDEPTFRLLSTTKWYMLRILEGAFPTIDELEANDTRSDKNHPEPEETQSEDETTDNSDEPSSDDQQDSPRNDAGYTTIEVTARGVWYTPSPVTVTAGEEVKLYVQDGDDLQRIFFVDGPSAWRDNDGGYILDTSQPGSFAYRCASWCEIDREWWILIE